MTFSYNEIIMSTPKIILFYVFTPLADPEAVMMWQRSLAESAGVKGRIIIAPHGINATVGGDITQVKAYIKGLRQYGPFAAAKMKWSDGEGDDFPRLSVKVRPELVSFGHPHDISVDGSGVIDGGARIKPDELHDFIDTHPDAVFFDGRNRIESQIGKFKDAYTPQVDTTKEFIELLDSGELDHLKERPVITYCTGGIRCELLTVHMKKRGFTNLFQLDGGIVGYGSRYGDEGLWEGSLYVFDNRMSINFSEQAAIVSQCSRCAIATDRVSNFPDPDGRELVVICQQCEDTISHTLNA